ncbi:unnamed protein product [Boreogadus saida]
MAHHLIPSVNYSPPFAAKWLHGSQRGILKIYSAKQAKESIGSGCDSGTFATLQFSLLDGDVGYTRTRFHSCTDYRTRVPFLARTNGKCYPPRGDKAPKLTPTLTTNTYSPTADAGRTPDPPG